MRFGHCYWAGVCTFHELTFVSAGLVAREDQTEDHGKEARKFVRMFAQSYDLAQALDFDRVEFHVLEAIEGSL